MWFIQCNHSNQCLLAKVAIWVGRFQLVHRCTRLESPGGREVAQICAKTPGVNAFLAKSQGFYCILFILLLFKNLPGGPHVIHTYYFSPPRPPCTIYDPVHFVLSFYSFHFRSFRLTKILSTFFYRLWQPWKKFPLNELLKNQPFIFWQFSLLFSFQAFSLETTSSEMASP